MRLNVSGPRELLEILAERFPDSTKTTLRGMLQSGRIRVNGEIEKNAKRVISPTDAVDVGSRVELRNLPSEISILHEDDDIIVIVKAAGLLTVSTEHENERTAQRFLNDYLRETRRGDRIHVVHRLDRDTSGVLLFAKNFATREALKEMFAAHDIDRVYVAIVEGRLEPPNGTFRSILAEDKTYKVSSVKDPERGKLAITHYRTVASGSRYSMLEVTLETGRKNQIRAHLSEAGHPVAGDKRYGAATNPISRLALHAKLLGFTHPVTGKKMTFTAPLPDVFRELKL